MKPTQKAKLVLSEAGMDLRAYLEQLEREFLRQALEMSGTKREAADLLRLSEQTFWMKLRKHDMLKHAAALLA